MNNCSCQLFLIKFLARCVKCLLPKAKKFKRWVTSDVLPSIRNTGAYIASNRLDELDDRVKKLESKTVIGKAQKGKLSYWLAFYYINPLQTKRL